MVIVTLETGWKKQPKGEEGEVWQRKGMRGALCKMPDLALEIFKNWRETAVRRWD